MTKDGTQDPGPPPVLTDPVSGLVTGSRYEPEPLKVRVVEPPMPDLSAVREAMVGMLDDDSELGLGLVSQGRSSAGDAPTGEIPVQSTGDPTPTPQFGIPTQQTRSPAEPPPAAPAAPAVPAPAAPAEPTTPPAGGPVRRMPQEPVNARVITPGSVERTRRLPSRIRRIRRRRQERPAAAMGRKSSGPSLAVIGALLLVVGVIVIVLIASLINTISSIFG